jgi:hypothetical protein
VWGHTTGEFSDAAANLNSLPFSLIPNGRGKSFEKKIFHFPLQPIHADKETQMLFG